MPLARTQRGMRVLRRSPRLARQHPRRSSRTAAAQARTESTERAESRRARTTRLPRGWYRAEILRHDGDSPRKYLVRWTGSAAPPSWVGSRDVSRAAVLDYTRRRRQQDAAAATAAAEATAAPTSRAKRQVPGEASGVPPAKVGGGAAGKGAAEHDGATACRTAGVAGEESEGDGQEQRQADYLHQEQPTDGEDDPTSWFCVKQGGVRHDVLLSHVLPRLRACVLATLVECTSAPAPIVGGCVTEPCSRVSVSGVRLIGFARERARCQAVGAAPVAGPASKSAALLADLSASKGRRDYMQDRSLVLSNVGQGQLSLFGVFDGSPPLLPDECACRC